MRKILIAAVVFVFGAGLLAVGSSLPARAAPPKPTPSRVSFALHGSLSWATDTPSLSSSYVVPQGMQLVVESVSRGLRVPGGPAYQFINQLAVSPASAGNPPPFSAMQRAYALNVWPGNPLYQINKQGGAECPADEPYIMTGDTNALTAVIGSGEQLGINLFILKLDPNPTGDYTQCVAFADYTVTGILEPAST